MAATRTASRPVARPVATGYRRRYRAGAVLGVVLVNVVLWAVGRGLGVDFVITSPGSTAAIDLPTVVIFSAGFALLGWGSLALLERFSSRARTVWTVLAIAVVALSEVPIYLVQGSAGTKFFLTLIHVAVAAVLVPALRRR